VNKETLVESLSKLTVLELAELKEALEKKWGVKAAAAAPTVVAVTAGAEAGPAAPAEESTDFEITLVEAPADKRIQIIKAVREVTGLGLKEAKELVEAAPKPIKASSPKAEAEEAKTKLEAAGGKVKLRGL
jgi:large subunit ribosomal protein L7/L12